MKLSSFNAGTRPNDEKELMDKYNELSGKSSEELTSILFDEVAKQKREGTFNYEAIESVLERMRGSMSDEMYNNLKRMLGLIR